MHLQVLLRPRLWPVSLLVAFAATAMLISVSPSPKAQAESGRRICVYTDQSSNGTHTWDVIDYKKDGNPECPQLYSKSVNARTGTGDADKMTCEDFVGRLGQPARPDMDLGSDPCPILVDDHVYQVDKDESANTYSWADKGEYHRYQRSIHFHANMGVSGVYRFCATAFDSNKETLRRDCDSVGVNGTSRLFYPPGTTMVGFTVKNHLGVIKAQANSLDVSNGPDDARSVCVDTRGGYPKAEHVEANYCNG